MRFRAQGKEYNTDWFRVIDSWGTGFYLADQEHVDQTIFRSLGGDYYLLGWRGPSDEIIGRIRRGESLEPYFTMTRLDGKAAERMLLQRRKSQKKANML